MTEARIPPMDRESPEYLAIQYGPDWRNHLVPDPETIDPASSLPEMVKEAANDTPPEERGPNSRALVFHISSRCAGEANRPTAAELYEAFHTKTPTDRTRDLVLMWMNEASKTDFLDAWFHHCYSWREIATACKRHGITNGANVAIIRRFAPLLEEQLSKTQDAIDQARRP